MPSNAISRELLSGYQGLHISKICTAVGFVDDAQNHCAHFVNHVLGVDASLNCGQLKGRSGPSANIRVHETFALCPSVGKFEDRPGEPCLAFVVQRSAVDLAAHRMTNVPKKHIGIFCDGEIWHYSNTLHKVVRQTPADFARHFSGDGFALFFGTFPPGARALAAAGVGAAPARSASSAPLLEKGQTDSVDVAVWQQFLIVRHLLNGPNIRTLLDGNFGEKTEDATEAFQVAASLPADGVVDAATNLAAIEQGFIPRSAARPRQALTLVTPAMTEAAVDALHRLGPTSFFYTEEELNIDGQRIVARLEPHKHNTGTQLRFWHRGITLYAAAQDEQALPTPPVTTTNVGYAGMDTSVFPGDAVMAELRASTNLVWTGFYLAPAPSHPGTSWMKKRAVLLEQGWGLAPLYLGQQEAGPGSHQVSAAQGDADGADALVLAQKAEFPAGTIIYLDIEKGGPLSAAMREYVQHWCAQVKAGGFVPGAYLSHLSAASARQAVPDLVLWVFRIKRADFGVDKDAPFRDAPPSESGVLGAVAWQWAQNCKIPAPVPGGKQLVDLDVASTPDPSRLG